MSIYCSKCGTEIPENVNFCSKCGAVVVKVVEENKTANKAMPISSLKQTKRVQDETISQVQPWIRYLARLFDIIFGSTVVVIFFLIIAPSAYFNLNMDEADESLLGALFLFLWVFVESVLLSTWGTTPGKWLLKTTVRNSKGQKLTFSSALKRSFSVWLKGLGAGFPIATFITMLVAYNTLKSKGITTWDKAGGFVVLHKRISALRTIFIMLLFVSYIFWIVYTKTIETSGW